MVWNKNAGYGREQVESILASSNRPGGLTFGRTLYVLKTTDPNYDRINDLFPVDPEGEVRLFTTITAALEAVENYDTILIGPGNFDEKLKVTLTGKYGVKIIGTNTGMQWGEGSTCWRNVVSTDDILGLTTCRGIEIAGIGFVNVTSGKNILELNGNCNTAHIHDCCFMGSSGGGANPAAAGITHAAGDNPDTYIHDCLFMHCTAGVYSNATRCRIINNRFIGVTSGIGIEHIPGASSRPDCIYSGNEFIGHGTTDFGIKIHTAVTAGKIGIFGNYFANCNTAVTSTVKEIGCGNLEDASDEPEYVDLGNS